MNPAMLFDGAFGSYILQKYPDIDFPEMVNISVPDAVLSIHQEYIQAGVTAIKTNTFGVNSKLTTDTVLLKKTIKNGYDLATQAATGNGIKVFADIGPITSDHSTDEYRQLTDIFLECGASHFLFETLNEINNLRPTIGYIKTALPNSLVIVSFAVCRDGYTKTGEYYQSLLEEAAEYGVDYTGLNCICGPSHMLELIKKLPINKYNLTAMPNAGYPAAVNGRTLYIDNPDYYAEKLSEMYGCGVKVLGGCCGTTPEHIKKCKEKLENIKTVPIPEKELFMPLKNKTKGNFSKQGMMIAVEISPPSDTDIAYTINAAKKAKEAGADFITVPDSPLGKARANSFMVSSIIKRAAGIEVIPHVCCRDKNQIALKGDLLAARMEGINAVLAVTGDAVPEACRSDTKHVFGFNSFQLISFIKNLNETVFAATPYIICAALNTNAENFDTELKRAAEKHARGADYFFTQPIFTQTNFENLLEVKSTLPCKILAGIMPLSGYKNALFLHNEVPGITIPEKIITALKDKDKKEAAAISLGYAKEIVDMIGKSCDGYYIMTPLKKINLSIALVEYILGGKI